MSELAREREALSRTCLKAMRAKGLTFKSLAEEIDVSPFITAAALLGQMALPKEVAARAAKALGFKEAEAFLTEIPYRGSLGMAVPTDPTDLPLLRDRAGIWCDLEAFDSRRIRRRHHERDRLRPRSHAPARPERRPGPHRHDRQVP